MRGHRVSSCHHTDRHLVHVNKKGRPVSQCQHCRGLRKSRSSHVHCECQTKGHTNDKCPHGDQGDGKTGKLRTGPNLYVANLTENGTCCCKHSGKCTCSLKKDHLDSVPEDMHQLIQPKQSPKAHHVNHNSHDTKTTIFQNGHHKPVHKFNDIHNQLGPYKVPGRSGSLHGHRDIAQRSTDSLPLTQFTKPHHESPLHTSMTPAEARRVKSEHNSPILGPVGVQNNNLTNDFQIPPFDPNQYGYSPFGTGSPVNTTTTQPDPPLIPDTIPQHWFFTYDQAQEYGNAVDWSQYNFDSTDNLPGTIMSNNNFGTNQMQDFTGLNQFTQLNNQVAPSSGDLSEADDFVASMNRPSVPRTLSQDASNDFSSPAGDDGTSENHRHSTASSYYSTPQPNAFSPETQTTDLDEILKQTAAETQRMSLQSQTFPMQQIQQSPSPFDQQPQSQAQRLSNASHLTSSPSPLNMTMMANQHPFTVHEAQEMAHLNDGMRGQKANMMGMSTTSMAGDAYLSQAPDMSNPALVLDDAQEEEDWVR